MKRYKSVKELFEKVEKSKEEYHNRKLSFEEKLNLILSKYNLVDKFERIIK